MKIPRRNFITLVGGATVAWPLAARAQQTAMPVVGFLGITSPELIPHLLHGLRRGLNEAGYIERRNLAIEYRWANGKYERLAELAADLVRRQVAVIIAAPTPAVLPAKAATTTIPIVFLTGGDPVELGLVASLNRPGGNLTGVSILSGVLVAKRLEILHELVPKADAFAVLVNPTNKKIADSTIQDASGAAQTLGLKLEILNASKEADFETAFVTASRHGIGALVVGADGFFNSNRDLLVAAANRHAVPTMYEFREFATGGGLVSYGTDISEMFRQMGVYTGRILKGEKPGDLPVQQATKVELIINMKTAKALGLTVPLPLLGRADEVIE
jgi:putative ABC transport system substrate-binding protein